MGGTAGLGAAIILANGSQRRGDVWLGVLIPMTLLFAAGEILLLTMPPA